MNRKNGEEAFNYIQANKMGSCAAPVVERINKAKLPNIGYKTNDNIMHLNRF